MSEAVTATGILVKRGTGTAGTTKAVTSSSVANPSVITTAAHGFVTGQRVKITGHTGSTPDINKTYSVIVLTATTFSIPEQVTVGGTGGTAALEDTYETIAEIVNVTPPGFSRNKLPTTTHNEGRESSVLSILMQKDPSFVVNYVGSDLTHKAILADILANVKHNWQFAFPSGTTYTGPARVSNFEHVDAPAEGAIQQVNVGLVWAGEVFPYNPAV